MAFFCCVSILSSYYTHISDTRIQPFDEGDAVLVESKCGRLLWDAVVVGVSRFGPKEKSLAYRVHYKGWSSRFDEWVASNRVVEPSVNNKRVQVRMTRCMKFRFSKLCN